MGEIFIIVIGILFGIGMVMMGLDIIKKKEIYINQRFGKPSPHPIKGGAAVFSGIACVVFGGIITLALSLFLIMKIINWFK